MANFSITEKTATTVSIYITGLLNGDNVRIFVRLYDDPDDVSFDKTVKVYGNSLEYTAKDLEPETKYLINVGIVTNIDGVNVTDWGEAQDFTTKAARPEDWEWWNTIKSGKPILLEAEEWNAFCERINEFRVWFGVDEYDFTYVEPDDPIAADIVNEARRALMTITADIPAGVDPGDPITAQFFLDLRDALNAVE